jgi:CubicO group peptidase (beta-lactamase class C family)
MTVPSVIQDALGRVFPAAQVVVHWRGQAVLARADGWLDPETRQSPAREDTQFDLGSVTKLFVATAFMTLVEQRCVELDQPLGSVLPRFTGQRQIRTGTTPHGTPSHADTAPPQSDTTADAGRVTFRQLLTHSAGLPAWRPLFREVGHGPAAVRNAVLDTWFAYPPGTRTVYSDLGFALLGFAIEQLTGLALDDVVRQRLTAPLRLDRTNYRPIGAQVATHNIAPTELCPWRQRRLQGEVHDELAAALGGVAGHAGLFSTAADVAVFGQAFLRGAAVRRRAAPAGGAPPVNPPSGSVDWCGPRHARAPANDAVARESLACQRRAPPRHARPGDTSAGPSNCLGQATRQDSKAPAGVAADPDRARAASSPAWMGTSLLHSETVAEMTRPQGNDHAAGRGLGFALCSADADANGQPFSPKAFGHTGFPGTSLWIDPARELVVACLTNRVWYGRDAAAIAAFRVGLHRALVDALDRAGATA